ncbi:sigma-54 dependent transcriptional regulator [bacterium]|nr:sigma-54 dependent transcriptional regulator [bacterium]
MTLLNAPLHILIADDQEDVLTALRLLLKSDGFKIVEVNSPKAVLQSVQEKDFDVVLMDMNYSRDTTSGEEGLELLGKLREIDKLLPIVVITGWGSIDLAVEAMKRGANDFIQKPWDNTRLLTTLKTQANLGLALRESNRLKAENSVLRGDKQTELIADAPSMKPVLDVIERVGPSDANVLILGENGTGKGVVARALHEASSRSSQPLVTVNIGGLSEGVFASELFGHIKGAFTDAKSDRVGRFEMAHHGTLFLDEIADVPINEQPKLLRVLETGEYERVGSSKTYTADVRILSATNADLTAEANEKRFRQDLLFRLNTVEIHIPPLRERTEDISKLAMYFLLRHARRYRKPVGELSKDAVELMMAYQWPGNVRELDHTIERAVLMSNGPAIKPLDLGLNKTSDGAANLMDMSLEDVERYLIQRTIARFQGNVSKAANALGLSRPAMYRRMEKYDL